MSEPAKKRSKAEKIVWRIVLVLFAFLVLSLFVDHPIVMMVGGIITGWIMFLIHVPTRMQLNGSAIATGVGCLIGVLVIGHLLARWLWRETRGTGDGPTWRLRWTLASVALFIVMFVCGTGAT